MTDTATDNQTATTSAPRIVNTGAAEPYVLQRDEGAHLHFLNQLATRKVSGADGSALTAVEFVHTRGFGPPLHCHDDEDEIVVVLDGEVAFRSGDSETVGRTGSVTFLPHGVPHSFQVLSDECRILAITASVTESAPRFDQMVAALGTPAPDPVQPEPTDIDPGHVAQVSSSFGIEILGPPPAPLADR